MPASNFTGFVAILSIMKYALANSNPCSQKYSGNRKACCQNASSPFYLSALVGGHKKEASTSKR